MHNFRTAFAAALQAVCIAASAGVADDIYVRVIHRHPDVRNLETVDTVAWYSEEAVRLDVEPVRAGRRLSIPDGSTAAWIVADELGTNWLVRYDLAPTSNGCTFALAAGEGRLPPDHDYTGFVTVLSGTNVIGVVDRHRVSVAWNPADPGADAVMPPSEYPPIVDAVQQFLAESTAQVSSNTAAIAALEEAVANIPPSGVTAINTLTGAVSIAAGSNVTVSTAGQTVTISATSGGGGSAVVDTNAIVAAAVEAGRSEFYGMDATHFGAGRDLACFGARKGFISMAATSLVYATQLKLGTSDPVSKWSDITPWFMTDSDTWGTDGDIIVDGDIHAHSDLFITGSITIGGEARTNWPSGGGGSAWQPTSRVITSATYTVAADDCLVWLDSEAAQTNQVVTLPDLSVDGQIVTIRHLGGDFPATIQRGTSTYTLHGDGAALTCDWLAAKTNWYWRTAW